MTAPLGLTRLWKAALAIFGLLGAVELLVGFADVPEQLRKWNALLGIDAQVLGAALLVGTALAAVFILLFHTGDVGSASSVRSQARHPGPPLSPDAGALSRPRKGIVYRDGSRGTVRGGTIRDQDLGVEVERSDVDIEHPDIR